MTVMEGRGGSWSCDSHVRGGVGHHEGTVKEQLQ